MLLATVASMPLAAFADENNAYLDQSGPGNTASIDQSGGSRNDAGSASGSIEQFAGQPLTQVNTLTIVQSGDDNSIGLTPLGSSGTGFRQQSQKTNGSSADILQASNDNVIGSVFQSTRFGGSYQSGNTLTVEQSGGDGNTIAKITQDRDGGDNGSTADIKMLGAGNAIDQVTQVTKGSAATPRLGNDLTVTISGDSNGTLGLSGFAAASGATDSSFIQGTRYYNGILHSNNTANVDISGSNNEFGVTQLGDDNTIGTLDIDGNSNQVGTYQYGNRNLITISTLSVGNDFNNVGVTQFDDDNEADVTVSGSTNSFGVYQSGDRNGVMLTVDGSGNGLAPLNATGLVGSALTASNGSLMFEVGMIKQFGDDNDVTAGFSGERNLFGMVQDGALNVITASVTGNDNVSAVVQVGGSNVANYTQGGNGNNVGILQ
ncbi:hypothetical protein ATO6_13690 [Oceanicola sp. 22II-s10i]|nr:hypothetical protein ATO6_13690 [Oceanicola sp. 22II-s10i]